MAKIKYDGVVEAVRYNSVGEIAWVRVYLRNGPVFSDRILLTRADLLSALKSGKNFMTGSRIPYLGAKFEVNEKVHLSKANSHEFIVSGNLQDQRDRLTGVPVF